MNGLLGQSFQPVIKSVQPFQPTQQGPQFSNPLFNPAPVNPYMSAPLSQLFQSQDMPNAPVPYVQQPSSASPFKPPMTWQQQAASYQAGNGGK